MIRLTGERVVLRPFDRSEYDLVWEQELKPAPGHAPPRGDLALARQDLERRLSTSGSWTEQELRLAIEAEGALVGDCQARISRWAIPPGVTELGIAIFDGHRGRGIGTDALRTIAAFLLEGEGFHRIQLSTDVDNMAMRAAAERAGFRLEGILRGFIIEDDGPPRDYAMYGRTRADHDLSR